MKDRNHIDDLFRDELSNHQITPPNSNWNGMQSALDNLRLEHIAKVKLANQAITPAKSVWHNIATKLWWKQFIRFSALKFNVYYAAVSLVGIIGAIIITNQNNTLVYQPEEQLHVDILKTKDIYNSIDLLKHEKLNPTPIANQAEQIEINRNVQENKSNNNSETKSTAQMLPYTSEAAQKNSKKRNLPLKNITQESEIIHKQEVEDPKDQSISQLELSEMPLILHQIIPLSISGKPLNINNYAPRPDTLGYDYQNEPIVKNLSFIEQGYSAGVIFVKQDFKLDHPEMQSGNNINQDYSQFSYRFGIRFNYVKNNYILQTGLHLANLNNTFKHTTTHLIIHDNTPSYPYPVNEWPYESDTITEYRTHKYNNSYSFIELPILVGTHFENEKFGINIKTGAIFNLVTGVNSKLLLESDQIISTVHRTDFIRPGIRWELSADLIYRFNHQISVFLEPSYVYDLTNMFHDNYKVKSRFKGYSASFGIYYRF